MDNKEIKYFNLNKTKKLYDYFLNKFFVDNKRCRVCNGPIYYENSSFRKGKNGLKLINKSYQSNKELFGKKYYLSVCEDCLIDKFPKYKEINKSRIFNRICDITIYAFNIPLNISEDWKKKNYSITLKNLINKYGEIKGKQKWEEYCKKQSKTNTFEYKKEKYGWNKDDFDKYNKSRSITLENLINKYGETDGIKLWDNYIEKQKITKSKEFVINKYGEKYWEELCNKKSRSLKNIINKKGKINGIKYYKNNFNNINVYPPSKSSQMFFDKIDIILNKKYKTYYFNKNEEYCIFDDELGFIFLDYYIKDLNLTIEFNGDIWHANPYKYKENDLIPILNEKAKKIWEKDKKRYNILKQKHNINTIIIWENNKPSIEKLLKLIKNKINNNE